MSTSNYSYEFTKYVVEIHLNNGFGADIREMIAKYGVAIIPGVLNDEECNRMINGIWDYFEHITSKWEVPIQRHDVNTWNEIYKLYPSHSMLFQHFGIGHTQCIWDLRQNEKIVEIFAHIWECEKEDLLVSFDGLSFNIPPEYTNRGWNRNHTWFHTDQSYTRVEFECVQSWVTGFDVKEGDATLAFMEGSQKYHSEFAHQFGVNDKKDWYKLNEEQEAFYRAKGCAYKKIACPRGSLVLWDSRTIHCGIQAMKNRRDTNFRTVVYLCYTPRNMANEKKIKKKINAFENLRMTSHWPHRVTMFPKKPRTYGGHQPVVIPIKPPLVNELGRKLIGY